MRTITRKILCAIYKALEASGQSRARRHLQYHKAGSWK
jgi:hypothetical protein